MDYSYMYLGVTAIFIGTYVRFTSKKHKKSTVALNESIEQGMTEPPSLHPVFDPLRCIGSGSCTKVCPEHAIGVINGKAVLVNAAHCIGHGACLAACPFDAIKLVFGTEKRGIDIPNISPDFETNVPGVFIAGELGGMGLIRKAAQQGREAIGNIVKKNAAKANVQADYDVFIVGCGPAGLSSGLSAMHNKLKYRLIEQEDSLGGTVYHYPRNKIAMTAPVVLDIIGTVKFGEVQKEKLLEFWLGVVEKTKLQISFRERMEAIEKKGDVFVVKTNKGEYTTKSVLLSMGRRGTPRKLEVPGEETPKVVYRLIDAEQYKGQSVLVVGGGDSALEAAIAVAEQPDTHVILSYRSEAFSRVKQKNRLMVEQAEKTGKLKVMLKSKVIRITDNEVEIDFEGEKKMHKNDIVIVCAGGLLPTPLLQSIGINFETKFGKE
jgi:thioredoxin reductase (NADPH)